MMLYPKHKNIAPNNQEKQFPYLNEKHNLKILHFNKKTELKNAQIIKISLSNGININNLTLSTII
jgi:hypothetical protein